MIVKVHPHKVEITKTPVNENEANVTLVNFEFDEEYYGLIKEAYFTLKGHSYKVLIQDDMCYIPNEVLTEKGTVELGVVGFEVENETTIQRYNPSPDYFDTWSGSLREADNTEPITPTDKEQIESLVQEVRDEMDNLDIEAEKVDKTTTITITKKDGTTEEVEILDGIDGEKGDKGDKGDAGAIKMLIVAELPSTGADDTIYLVPLENPDVQGNNYAEYVYINGAWELLGKIGVQVDLTDYVKFTDYAGSNKGGVIKTSNDYGTSMSANNQLIASTRTYAQYTSGGNGTFIGKGTLENVITGKGLVSNTDYATSSTGGVVKLGYGISLDSQNKTIAQYDSYETYLTRGNYYFISKGTLENVLTNRIGNIQTLLDNLDTGVGV